MTLAQALAGEADLRARRDWSLIAWTLARVWRWQGQGWTFAETARRHTMLSNRGPRAAWANALPWGPLVTVRREGDRRGWLALQGFVVAWGRGAVPDVCPMAVTWSESPPGAVALRNVAASGLVELDCGTRNVPFGRERGR